uniref:Uncharacterized protein n=1 Tax=Oryza meridionalis TaxID=40149 RepID=A0A0E0F364_9ORYZ
QIDPTTAGSPPPPLGTAIGQGAVQRGRSKECARPARAHIPRTSAGSTSSGLSPSVALTVPKIRSSCPVPVARRRRAPRLLQLHELTGHELISESSLFLARTIRRIATTSC